MNLIGTTTRTALKIAKLPADVAVRLVGRGQPGREEAAHATVDRADAAVRDTVGRAADDEQLRAEAQLGKAAAEDRGQVADLQKKAAKKKEEAVKQRKRVAATAEAQRAEAEDRAAMRKREASEQAAAEHERQRDREESARLEQLRREEQALAEREGALEARGEAQRLETAAGAAKAQRKRDS